VLIDERMRACAAWCARRGVRARRSKVSGRFLISRPNRDAPRGTRRAGASLDERRLDADIFP